MATSRRPGSPDLPRRRLLRGGVAAVGAVVAGCGSGPPAPAATPTPPAPPTVAVLASQATPPAAPSPSVAEPTAVATPAAVATSPPATPPTTRPPLAPLPTIEQPATPTPAAFMARAVAMRQQAMAAGDQPFGAIVVKDSRIVGLGPSQVVVNGDPTAHAEMEAIRDACRRLGTRDLSGCVLYATSRPCRMCEAASVWANIARFYYGDQLADGGAPRLSAC